jgi:hypothetical protein
MVHLATIAVVLGLASTAAFAEPAGVPSQAQPMSQPPLIESYRLQTVLADGAALLTLAAGAGSSDSSTFKLGVGIYLLGAPIVHLVHHRPGRAFGDLALRAGIPAAATLLLVAAHTNPCSSPDANYRCTDWGALAVWGIGLIGGATLASVLDTSLLAKGDDPPARSWSPAITPSHGGVTLGVAGSF